MKKFKSKSILRILTSRMVIFSLLILLQAIFFAVIVVKLSEAAVDILLLFQFLSVCVVVWIVSKKDNPSYKLAWCIAILTFPILGGVFYLMWGNKNVSKNLRRRIMEFYYKNLDDSYLVGDNRDLAMERLKEQDEEAALRAEYIKKASGHSVQRNTQAEYFALGEDKFHRMLQELKKAEKFIFMEYFIIQEGKMWDPILKVLEQKAQENIEVRLMFDDVGCLQTLPAGYAKYLSEKGISTTVFNPFRPHMNMAMNYRDHRKICVIDGNVGFCGGINLADEYINAYEKHGHWKDTAVMLTGDAVWNLTTMFLSLWDFTNGLLHTNYSQYRPTVSAPSDGYVQIFGDSPLDNLNVAENVYLQMINRANRYVYITTPYLIIDNEMMTALCLAAESGVDVRIITPHIPDKWYVHMVTRSYYGQLVQSGVKIYEYTPGFVHAKMMVSDDNSAVVGTANMDYRSFYLHFECGVCFYHSSMVKEVKADMEKVLEKCQQITLEETKSIGLFRRVLRGVLRLFAPMM